MGVTKTRTLAALCTAALLSACGHDAAPEAIAVAVAPSQVTLAPGGTQQFVAGVAGTATTTVTWSVEPATCGQITTAGLYTAPASEGTCTVRATAQADTSKSASAAVTVVKPAPVLPVINSFAASPASIAAGASSTLSWSVTGADTLAIDQGVGAVTGTSKVVSPSATTVYTLTATSAAGSVTAQATVTLTATAPVIGSFTATPASISAGQTSTLAWTVTGAATLSLDQGVGAVTGTSKVVSPGTTTVYKLTASNGVGATTAQATVTVATGTPPTITSFTATPAQLTAGQSATLAWTTTGGGALSIDQGVGAVTGTSKVVSPTSSVTYLLSTTAAGVTATMPVTITVAPATAGAVIHQFAVEGGGIDPTNASAVARFQSLTIKSGGSAKLRWSVANVSSGQITSSPAGVTQLVPGPGFLTVSPSATTTYTLAASGGGQSPTAQVTVVVNPAAFATPTDPGTADVTVTVDSGVAVHPISPFVYGYNAGLPAQAPSGATLLRQGGNRWTAWNWETGASNAGSDFNFQSDTYLSPNSSAPGGALKPTLDAAQNRGSATSGFATLITVPMQGWVAADTAGPVAFDANHAFPAQAKRFLPLAQRKGSALSASPDLGDKLVYADELVKWVETSYPLARTDAQRPIHYSLDNEPDLWFGPWNAAGGYWAGTHTEIQPAALSYAELISKSINTAAAIKDVAAGAVTYGVVSYGWSGFQDLQGAPDAAGRDFLDTFLAALKAASEAQGRRLLDVLDLHFYSEATGGGQRVTNANNGAAVAAARVQATRSLWESTYGNSASPALGENSWITGCCVFVPAGDEQPGPAPAGIDLVPRMLGKIAARFPGTRLSFSEYNHGGGDHISGAVAEADTLGIFGRSGVYSAAYWPMISSDTYTFGAFRLYRNYDGGGGVFGDTSISAASSSWSLVSAHASMNAGHPEKLFVVIINRDVKPHTVALKLTNSQTLTSYTAFQIAEPVTVTSGSVIPKALGSRPLVGTNSTSLDLCPSGVTGCVTTTSVPQSSATLLVLQ